MTTTGITDADRITMTISEMMRLTLMLEVQDNELSIWSAEEIGLDTLRTLAILGDVLHGLGVRIKARSHQGLVDLIELPS